MTFASPARSDGQPADPRRDVRVAHGDRVAGHDLQLHGGAVRRADPGRHPRDQGAHQLARLRRHGPDRPLDLDGLRDDVVGRAAADPRDREDRRVEGIHGSGRRGLEREDQLGGGRDGVEGLVGRGGVATAAPDGRADRVRGGEERTRPQGDGVRRVLGADVDRERPCHGSGAVRTVLEQALLDHEAGAVVALLARLEHQQDPSGQRVTPLHEQARGPQQHRDVGVVAAAVHRANVLGRELEAGVLGERQAVHVGPQQDRRARGARPR